MGSANKNMAFPGESVIISYVRFNLPLLLLFILLFSILFRLFTADCLFRFFETFPKPQYPAVQFHLITGGLRQFSDDTVMHLP